VVEQLLTLAITMPTLGCRQFADRLEERGHTLGKTTVQKILNDHGLGLRRQRIAKAAALAAAVNGLVTDAAREDGLFGFCHYAANPGDLVALDSFYIGNLKGVGRVYQLTAVDTATRWAMMLLVLGTPSGEVAARFLLQVRRRFARIGIEVRGVLTDNGPEWVAMPLRAAREKLGIAHHRTPPRSPNHNAVCERFQGTALEECWRPAFHRRRFTTLGQLQREADAWLVHYNTRRRNHSDFMRGRTPAQVLNAHRRKLAS
jgi:transposase InsO family protein